MLFIRGNPHSIREEALVEIAGVAWQLQSCANIGLPTLESIIIIKT
jgi:hypothetical protein